MAFKELVAAAQKHFPDLTIKYKDQSKFMKFLGFLLFFNKKFMSNYTTTLGSTVYFPSETATTTRPVSSAITLLHEVVHVYDAKKVSKPVFGFLYLIPQVLVLLMIPLFFVLSWWIVVPLMLLMLAPIPAFFRMNYEKRAYLSSLYVVNSLSERLNFKPLLATQRASFLRQFKSSSYYFMWPFNNLEKEFDDAMVKIKNGERPFEDPIFDILDELMMTL